jgi:hypothetical protein
MEREARTVSAMMRLYCRQQHHVRELCPECRELLEYTAERLHKCIFKEGKTTCAKCTVHCFKPDMRQRIRVVMRYSGPRMIYHHPIMALQHLVDSRRKKPQS